MTLENIQGYSEALKALEANLSPRAKHLAGLERYVEGTQYAGLPDWFSDEKPLWERAPCIVYPIVRSAIDSNVDLLLGEGRYPSATVEDLEGDAADDFEQALARIVKQARLQAAAREVFAAGQGSAAGCAIFGVRSGRLFVDTSRARWCEPVIDAEGAVLSLTIQYPYLAIDKSEGTPKIVARLYRRVIDGVRDVTYLPGDARADAIEPQWKEDPAQTITHGLGFCPVVWYPHMRGCAIVGDFDGRAIHEHLTDEIRGHDFSLSQRHRAALYAGDPQWTEIGVEPGYNPTSAGRRVEVPASVTGTKGEKPHAVYVSGKPGRKARKKSPGVVWQYEGKAGEVEVKLHALPGDALKALDDHARDLRVKLAESLGVVFLDPESMPQGSTMSGRFLEAIKARQLDRCDNYRSDFGDRFLLPAIGMLVRIARAKKLRIQGIEAVNAVIDKAAEQWSWHAPPIALAWGRYFRLDAEEEAKVVDLVIKAKEGGVSTIRAAVEKLRSVFDIKDVDAFLDELETEKADAMKLQQKLAADQMLSTGAHDDDEGPDSAAVPRAATRPPRRRPTRAA